MRLRRASQLTLPGDIREALKVKEGDYLDAQIVKDGVLLKPVSMTERDEERHRAWKEIQEIMSRVKDLAPDPSQTITEAEEEIAEEVMAMRREERSRRKNG
jgi:bifunctional DNA-binding transcriptional regulator/antitoxin component of YhaV-PrlF toxin-antitoxin module